MIKVVFMSANSADPEEMLSYASLHLGLHCLPKYMYLFDRTSRMCMRGSRGGTGDLDPPNPRKSQKYRIP